MSILMATLESTFGHLRDFGGSYSDLGFEEKSKDKSDLEKESTKELSSSSTNIPSQSLFKMEVKVDIKPYQGEIDALKLNHWLQQLEVYISIHQIAKD